jgi:hypothetical protein
MGTQRVQLKGVLPWLVHWACLAGTRDFRPGLATLVGLHHFNSLATIAQQAGYAAVLGRLSLSTYVSLVGIITTKLSQTFHIIDLNMQRWA